MTPLFKKMNYKGQDIIHILDAPEEFESEMKAMSKVAIIEKDIKEAKEIEYVLTFVKEKKEIDTVAKLIHKKLKGDGVAWFAYPKGTSKKYKASINRDNGWDILGKNGFEAVRAIAIDEDWSALRFRRVEFIKTMIRSFAMTEAGKKKASSKS